MIIGFEAANSFVKICSDREEEVYPNTVRKIEVFEQEFDVIDKVKEDKEFRFEGNTYVVGERTMNFLSSSSRNIDRYKSSQYRLESILAIARHVRNGDDVIAVTGLPAAHYNSPTAKNDIIESLKGDYSLAINNVRTDFTISKVHVVLQPVGTITALVIDNDLTIKDKALMKATKCVIDIGWGTSDVAIMDGMKIIDTIPVDIAMRDAYESIEKGIKKEYADLRDYTFDWLKLEDQLREGDTFRPYLGKEYDVKKIKKDAFEYTANAIMAKIKNRVTLNDFEATIFTGGGIQSLSTFMKSNLEGVNALRVSEPQKMNARGFYIYGKVKANG
jgi:plasmid segregation protein ParM